MLEIAVIIAGDGTGTDIRIRADLRITDVGQMARLCTLAKHGIFHLDEVPSFYAFLKLRPRAKARERPNLTARASDNSINDAVLVDQATVSQAAFGNSRVRAYAHPIAEYDITREHRPYIDENVTTDGQLAAEIESPGIC